MKLGMGRLSGCFDPSKRLLPEPATDCVTSARSSREKGKQVSGGNFLTGVISSRRVVGLWFAAPPAARSARLVGAPARLRSRSSSPRRLALSELLGTVGLLRRVPLIVGAIRSVVSLCFRWSRAHRAKHPAGDPTDRDHVLRSRADLRGLRTAVQAAMSSSSSSLHGSVKPLSAYRAGVLGLDSLDSTFLFHTFPGRRTTALHFTVPGFEAVFHPANSELVLAVTMVAFRTDVLAPVMNLVWISLALLAAWCTGSSTSMFQLGHSRQWRLCFDPLLVAFDGSQRRQQRHRQRAHASSPPL